MYYIDALRLIRLAVEHQILSTHTQEDPKTGKETKGILFYVEGSEEPELWEEDYAVRQLMDDAEGEAILIAELEKKGVKFVRYEGSAQEKLIDSICGVSEPETYPKAPARSILVILQFEVGDPGCPYYNCKILVDADKFDPADLEDTIRMSEDVDTFELAAERALKHLGWDYKLVEGPIPACEDVWIITL